jgi:hypothetical protein
MKPEVQLLALCLRAASLLAFGHELEVRVCRFPHDQSRCDPNDRGLFGDVAFDSVDEDAGRSSSHLITRLHNGGEMGMKWAVNGEIVERR